jgi:hypothetical protein
VRVPVVSSGRARRAVEHSTPHSASVVDGRESGAGTSTPSLGRAVDVNAPAALLHRAVHHRQTEPRTAVLGLRREERLERSLWRTSSLIPVLRCPRRRAPRGVRGRSPGSDSAGCVRSSSAVRRGCVSVPPVRHGVARVHGEVQHHLLESDWGRGARAGNASARSILDAGCSRGVTRFRRRPASRTTAQRSTTRG